MGRQRVLALLIGVAIFCLPSLSEASGLNRKKSPVTTKGDIYVYSTKDDRLAVGTNGNILSVDSSTTSGLAWVSRDTVLPTTVKGDLITFSTQPIRLAVGSDGQVLSADSSTATGLRWVTNNVTLDAPVSATYITQTSNATLTNEQNLAALSTGILKSTTATGVVSIATQSVDYAIPTNTITGASGLSGGGNLKDNRQISLDVTNANTWTGVQTFNNAVIKTNNNGNIIDSNSNELLAFQQNASAVNYIVISNDATSKAPKIYASGDDANVSLRLGGKGTGIVSIDGSAFGTRIVTLTDAASIATDLSRGNTFTVTLGGNRTLDTPTNGTNGQKVIWIISQDATGSRTLAYSPAFRFGTDVTSPTLTTTAGSHDYIGGIYYIRGSAVKMASVDVVSVAKGYASQ